MTEAYPLQWPTGWKRSQRQEWSKFGNHPFNFSLNTVLTELKRLKATRVVVSTNQPLRQDGLPMANRRQPADTGVAVYFMLNGKEQCIPCDKWTKIEDNLWAIGKTIETLRGIERWGAKDMVDAAFRGFQALPDYSGYAPPPRYFDDCTCLDEARTKYKTLAKELHPDMGGDAALFAEMSRQYELYCKDRGAQA